VSAETKNKLGILFVWALFLMFVAVYAQPALIFIAAAALFAMVLFSVIKKLDEQGRTCVRKSDDKHE